MTAAGSIAAGLTLVKVNIGIFAILAVAVAVLSQSPPGWLWRTARYAAGGGALLFPFYCSVTPRAAIFTFMLRYTNCTSG